MSPPSHIFLLCIPLLLLSNTTMITLCLNQEGLDLLNLKSTLTDPTGILSSWNQTDKTPCNWTGITCHQTITTVISINLTSSSLTGPFDTTFICRLPSLTTISLHDNNLNSTIPNSISKCQNLTYLDLSSNYIHGLLPSSLTTIPNLAYLDLQDNDLSGPIPIAFASFPCLQTLNLTNNLLTGPFPAFLANVTSLVELVLAYNLFDHGPIPQELGNLSNIKHLWLSSCGFTGTIPDTFSNLRKLVNLELSFNSLTGEFPNIIFHLTNLYQLELYNNSFYGELPKREWSNMTSLRRIDLSTNGFTGIIPVELCKLPLSSLGLADNNFHGLIPESLATSPNLYDLRLFGNSLTGLLPSDLGKSSPLQTLDVSYNKLFGELPMGLCEKGELYDLVLIGNSFSGQLPTSLEECKSLQRIRVNKNKFSGEIPRGIWGLPHVYILDLDHNMFSGNLSGMTLGGLNLSSISISWNMFSGNLPNEIGLSLVNLVEFYASNNQLIGGIPESLFKLNHLGTLDLSNNHLSGQISIEIESLKELNELNVANNNFTGEIPNEIGNLPVLNYLDLSGNLLYGKIPSGLGSLILNKLNLSNNQLSGEIPFEYTKPVYRDSFLGNPGLCGAGFSHGCIEKSPTKNNHNIWLLKFIFSFAGVVLVLGVIWFIFKYKSIKKSNDEGVSISKWRSFHKLGFSEFEIVQLLNENNVIGSGSSGKVYKAILSNGETVAVKKLWLKKKKNHDSDLEKDEFESEVETLGKIRHKNIVKLWCCFESGNSKLLVYEYMPNGSLGDLLHGNKGSRLLEWSMRLKIIVDAAEGLSYLHHDSVPPIVHRDVKSNNILLDQEYGARIADFGVAKFINIEPQGSDQSMSVVAGSRGYLAPEYAYTLRVNEKSDIYSFGVVILELVTGRKPVDNEGELLAAWVQTKVNQKDYENVVDRELEYEPKEQIYRVLEIGVSCVSSLPTHRPSMRTVVNLLQQVTPDHGKQKSTIHKDGKVSPYFLEDNNSPQASLF